MKVITIKAGKSLSDCAQSVLALRMQLIGKLIHFAVPVFGFFYRAKPWPYPIEKLRELPTGTLGKNLATALDTQGYHLIPKYETHDVKHILLGYGMTGIGEIRLQAFLYGNGSRKLPTLGVFLLGLLLLPEFWPIYRKDMKRGKQCRPLHRSHLIDWIPKNIDILHKHINITPTENLTGL